MDSPTRRPPRILLCSAWQAVKIGDIAHTPGILSLLEKSLPGAEVTLWKFKPLTPPARELILRGFPKLTILESPLGADGEPDAEACEAIDRSDFFLHGSGPLMLDRAHAEAFVHRTGRGFGVFGVTYGLLESRKRKPSRGHASFTSGIPPRWRGRRRRERMRQ